MKQLFETGQKITPVTGHWEVVKGPDTATAPKFGEIYTVSGYDDTYKDYLSLNEMESGLWFHQLGFSPVMGDEELEKMLKEEPEFDAV